MKELLLQQHLVPLIVGALAFDFATFGFGGVETGDRSAALFLSSFWDDDCAWDDCCG